MTTGPPGKEMRRCAACGRQTPRREEFCLECGSPSDAQPAAASTTRVVTAPPPAGAGEPLCPKCGQPHRAGARFCTHCGAALSSGSLANGQTLAGRYRITGVIGGGGMGAVYRAQDRNLPTRAEPDGRSCAIKAIIDSSDPELLAAAASEREMLIRLDNPNIVRIYDIVIQDQIPFIVMALVQGTGWRQLLEQQGGRFPPSAAVRLIQGIVPAFRYLHHRSPPVVYRDFKPGNAIQVTDDDGTLRQVLIDLGTAIEYVHGQAVQAWGTVGYAPPEVRGVVEQTPAMDVYAIVSTLAELVGMDLDAWQAGGVPPREQFAVPVELYDLLSRGRSTDPVQRFQTTDELADQLDGVARFISAGTAGSAGSETALPIQSRLFTGSIGHRTTSRIAALPATDQRDPSAAAINQAQTLITAGRYSQALAAADAALSAEPASLDAHLVKAAALTNLGRNDEAKAELTAADRHVAPGTRWRTLIVQAQAAEAAGDDAGAERLFQELMRLVPGEVLPKQALADLYLKTSRYQDALALFTRVVQADPANADAVLGLADSLVAVNQPDEAIVALDRVSENAVRFVDAQLRLIELFLARVSQHPEDLERAGLAITALEGRVQSGEYFRLVGDWWLTAYELARRKALPPIEHWPDSQHHSASERQVLAARCRTAYRRYLRQEPNAPDADAILDRIYFGIDEWL